MDCFYRTDYCQNWKSKAFQSYNFYYIYHPVIAYFEVNLSKGEGLPYIYLVRGSSPALGLQLGLFDYCTSHIKKKTIFPVLPDRRRFGVNSKNLANPESQYNPRAPWRPFR